jgi:sugar lactone lactonase YvrE
LVDPTALLPPKFFNDLDIIDRTTQAGEERIVYFSDTSYKNTRSENRQEILDGSPRGRLFSFNIHRKELTVLACGLHFPNGVQILNDRYTYTCIIYIYIYIYIYICI